MCSANFLCTAISTVIRINEKITDNTTSKLLTWEISPNSASSNSNSGIKSAPSAKEAVKKTPTIVSTESWLRYSKNQMPITANKRIASAPTNGLILKNSASAMPGNATWESASPTSDIRFKIAKTPKRLAATAIETPDRTST